VTTHSDTDRALAFAGVFQAGALTRDLAREGNARSSALEASVYSIFQLDARDVPAVFGELQGMEMGLNALYEQIRRPQEYHRETMGYVVGLLHLERKLGADKERMAMLGREIQALAERLDNHELTNDTKYAALADIYQRYISSLSPRIMVNGEPLHLQNPDTASRIRTVLLAGIRAAHLWRQCGGNRWKLLFGRRALLGAAKTLLDHIS